MKIYNVQKDRTCRKQHTYMDYIFKLKYEKKNEKKNKELKYRYE